LDERGPLVENRKGGKGEQPTTRSIDLADIHMAPADDAVDTYLDVFRRFFEHEEHSDRYRMMMGTDFRERPAEVAAE